VKSCDFSGIDKHNIVPFLRDHPQLGEDYLIYAYSLITKDLSVDLMKRLTESSLTDALKDAGIQSSVHRQRIADAVLHDCYHSDDCQSTISSSSDLDFDGLSYDAYICNANPSTQGSKELVSLIAFNLARHGFSAFDHTTKNTNRSSAILKSKNFILVFSNGALDNVDIESSSFYKELIIALDSQECNIIIVKEPDFQFPDFDNLPERVRQMTSLPNLTWYHEYQKAFMGKLENLLKVDVNVSFQRQTSSTSNTSSTHMSCGSRSERSVPDRSASNYLQTFSTMGMTNSSPSWISGF